MANMGGVGKGGKLLVANMGGVGKGGELLVVNVGGVGKGGELLKRSCMSSLGAPCFPKIFHLLHNL